MSGLLDFLGGLAIMALVFAPLGYVLGGFQERRKQRRWEDQHGVARGSLARWQELEDARRNARRLEDDRRAGRL